MTSRDFALATTPFNPRSGTRCCPARETDGLIKDYAHYRRGEASAINSGVEDATGTNSVKWLWRLHLADRRADGLFTAALYNDAAGNDELAAGLPSRRPVWAVAPESIIVAPAPDATMP